MCEWTAACTERICPALLATCELASLFLALICKEGMARSCLCST